MRILIVEDSKVHARWLNHRITSAIEGVEVDWHFHGASEGFELKEVLIALLQNAYDVVISDLNFGIKSGFVRSGEHVLEFAQQFQEPTTILIVCGGHIEKDERKWLNEKFDGVYQGRDETKNLIAYLKEVDDALNK